MFSGVMSASLGSYSDTPLCSNYNIVQMSNLTTGVLHIKYGYAELEEGQEISEEWESDTLLVAAFNDNLIAGNIDFDLADIKYVRIKRKLKSENNNKYITLFEYEMNSSIRSGFTVYDNYARANKEYTYAVCYVSSDGSEGALIETDVKSDFCGVVLCDEDNIYFAELETSYSFSKNHNSSIVTTISNRHPYVIHNDATDYWTGQLSAMWAGKDDNDYDIDNQFDYREPFYDWLNNGRSKILKLDDGREWIINITGAIQESENEHWQKVVTSFDWTETGDCNNEDDLYKNGLISITST